MPKPAPIPAAELRQSLDSERLRDWVKRQRWYGSKSRSLTGFEIVEGAALSDDPPLYLALARTRFASGPDEIYQLLLTPTPDAPDALEHPDRLLELMRLIEAGAEVPGADGRFTFASAEAAVPIAAPAIGEGGRVRPMGVEQSNTSLVIDDSVVLKLLRKVEPGINPELEMLRFLSAHGFRNIAPLHGWYEYDGPELSATLGVAQHFYARANGGWELALHRIADDPDWLLGELGELGAVTAAMHTALASDAGDSDFAPEEPSAEAMSNLVTAIGEDIDRIFARLPEDERTAPIAGRGAEVRARLAARARAATGGRTTRTHGDYHLGQTLHTPDGWVILDFEGEPARPLPERRAKQSPLRDVAGMLRSFAYAASAAELQRGGKAPAGFEDRAREAFFDCYVATVEPSLMPAGEAGVRGVLEIFELEKVIYELRYELDNRPDWVPIPVAGIRRLLEEA